MSLYTRGEIWWIAFTAPNGQRIRESARTRNRQEAQEYYDRLKAEYWKRYRLKEKPRRIWQEAVVKWLKETGHKRTHAKDVERLKWIDPFLRDKYLDDIDRDLIDSIAEAKEAEGRSPATVNRYLAVIRSILRAAWQEWDWIDKAPKIRMRKEPKNRVRFLTRVEAERLLKELPEHLSEMARFALSTGLRMNNVVRLQWSQMDLTKRIAWIHPDESKNEKAIGVPLNTEAIEVLRRQYGKHDEFVFTYEGKPVLRASNHAWYKALKRAGIENFRWHDLRHTWASWHAQEGTPLAVLQELGGWSTGEMVKRYAHLTAGHLLEHAERISCDTKLSQYPVKVVK
ncbi:MAG: site-specific integrase [Nitrospirales bacterium]